MNVVMAQSNFKGQIHEFLGVVALISQFIAPLMTPTEKNPNICPLSIPF
jgi:hypothetical protein